MAIYLTSVGAISMNDEKRIRSSGDIPQIGIALIGLAIAILTSGHVALDWRCFASTDSRERQYSKTSVPTEDIEAAVRNAFGVKVRVLTRDRPFFLTGDFNGDGKPDIAVLVNIENAREELAAHSVKFIDIDPHSRRNGSQIDPLTTSRHNCVGVAIVHGTAAGWTITQPGNRYMFYECFSPFRLIRRNQRIPRGNGARGTAPVLKGDAIQLELESGGRAIVYWNGHTYRGFSQRIGD